MYELAESVVSNVAFLLGLRFCLVCELEQPAKMPLDSNYNGEEAEPHGARERKEPSELLPKENPNH